MGIAGIHFVYYVLTATTEWKIKETKQNRMLFTSSYVSDTGQGLWGKADMTIGSSLHYLDDLGTLFNLLSLRISIVA